MGMFSKGFEVSREETERQEKARAMWGKRLPRMYLKSAGDKAVMDFLNSEPVNYKEHAIMVQRNGKSVFDRFVCTQDDSCPLCAKGLKTTMAGAFLVIDNRPYEYTDKGTGKKVTKPRSLRLYAAGIRVLTQLDNLNGDHRLSNYQWKMTRAGSGTSTTYMFSREDRSTITYKEVLSLLPSDLKDSLKDLDEETIQKFLMDQLMMWLPKDVEVGEDDDSYDDDDDSEETMSSRSKIIKAEDDTPPSPRPSARGLLRRVSK